MRVLDPGHLYDLAILDGKGLSYFPCRLQFVKREGHGYPGNVGTYPGTTLQEVWRVCIDRLKYVNSQQPSHFNDNCIMYLRSCILQLERRAAIRHNVIWTIEVPQLSIIEELPVGENGHLLIGAGRD